MCIRKFVNSNTFFHIQSDLTYPHTSVLDKIVDRVREQSYRVQYRIIAALFREKLLHKMRELDIRGADK